MAYQIISDVSSKRGKTRRVRVTIAEKNGFKIKTIAINKNIKKKKYPSTPSSLKKAPVFF